jgi:hypothetical protein
MKNILRGLRLSFFVEQFTVLIQNDQKTVMRLNVDCFLIQKFTFIVLRLTVNCLIQNDQKTVCRFIVNSFLIQKITLIVLRLTVNCLIQNDQKTVCRLNVNCFLIQKITLIVFHFIPFLIFISFYHFEFVSF